jgi:hypothetical protein
MSLRLPRRPRAALHVHLEMRSGTSGESVARSWIGSTCTSRCAVSGRSTSSRQSGPRPRTPSPGASQRLGRARDEEWRAPQPGALRSGVTDAAALGPDARRLLADLAEASSWSARASTASCGSLGRSRTWRMSRSLDRRMSSRRPVSAIPEGERSRRDRAVRLRAMRLADAGLGPRRRRAHLPTLLEAYGSAVRSSPPHA